MKCNVYECTALAEWTIEFRHKNGNGYTLHLCGAHNTDMTKHHKLVFEP